MDSSLKPDHVPQDTLLSESNSTGGPGQGAEPSDREPANHQMPAAVPVGTHAQGRINGVARKGPTAASNRYSTMINLSDVLVLLSQPEYG